MDMSLDATNGLIHAYGEKALDTFVRGLKGNLLKLLSIREPVDLPQILHICPKLQNVNYRTQYANT